MKKKLFIAFFTCHIFIFFSCAGQNNVNFIPVPDFSVYDNVKTIEIGNIIETKNNESIPEWLSFFLAGGIEAVEKLDSFNEKYVFIGINEGDRFAALNKWAENFSAIYDFTILAANRIEKRMLLNLTLYPDDEYGFFFEAFIKNAYSSEYYGAVKEDIFWIKHSFPEICSFFIFVIIDKSSMELTVNRMMSEAHAATSPTGSQAASVNRLRQTFFEGF